MIAQWRRDLIKAVDAIKAFDDTATDEIIAERLQDKFGHFTENGLTKNVIIGARRDYKSHQETVITTPPLLKRWTKNKYEYVSIELPRYDIKPILQGDHMVSGDWQLPAMNYKLFDLHVEVAKQNMDTPKFAVIGDLVNLDRMSSYDSRVPVESLQTEINLAKGALERLMNVGDVKVFQGNHEYRWSRNLEGVLDILSFWELVQHGMKTGSIQIFAETSAWLHSGKQKWLLTHQRNYSRIKGRVANQLAMLRQTNVICFHQHHFGGIASDNGLYAAFDNGGLHDDSLMDYPHMYDSTMPRMTNGFNMVRDGIGHQFTPYEQMTDYSLYGVDASEVFAYERKKQAIYTGNYTRDSEGVIKIGDAA